MPWLCPFGDWLCQPCDHWSPASATACELCTAVRSPAAPWRCDECDGCSADAEPCDCDPRDAEEAPWACVCSGGSYVRRRPDAHCPVCGRAQPGDEDSAAAPAADWCCAPCTLVNPPAALTCVACMGQRPGGSAGMAGWQCDCGMRVAAFASDCPACVGLGGAAAAADGDGGGWDVVPSKPKARSRPQPRAPVDRLRGAQLVLLCGLPGAGKSTLSARLPPDWVVVNQDTLGSRQECEAVADAALRDGRRVVVDRCNHDPQQRAHWTRMAQRHRIPEQRVAAVWLKVPTRVAEQRVMARAGHPTLPATDGSRSVVRSFASQFAPPRRGEQGLGVVVVAGGDEEVDAVVASLT